MKFHRLAYVLAGLLLVVAVGATPQGGSNPAANAAQKIAVISIRDAIGATAEGKQAVAELQSQFAPRQNDIENLRKQIDDLQKRLETGSRTLSPDEQGRLQREGELKSRKLQRMQDELQEEINAAQGEIVDRIGRKLLDVLDRYARENAISLVLDKSAQNSPVVNSSNQIDLTQEIVRLYDAQYPVKASAPAPAKQPTAPPKKPGTNPPQQP
jgi:outer membrane protein